MNKDNFISQLLQIFGFISAIAVAFSQYIFRDNFKFLFGESTDFYSLSSLVALILSLVLIVVLYAERYFLSVKIYLDKEEKRKYFEYLRSLNNNVPDNIQPGSQNTALEPVNEPFNFNIKKISIFLIFVSLLAFTSFILFDSIIVKSLSHVIFICTVVTTITTFAIQLYLDNEYKQKQKDMDERILEKVKEYFSGEIKIKLVFKDERNLNIPNKQYIIEREGRTYKVIANYHDPDKYFSIEEQTS